jgi:predicted 3-demethylubiquinone-9 3-methyltransferase (glyoxalase superfamily)
MQKITPFLWFNDNAEAAVDFYVSIFKNSKVLDVSRYGEGGPMPAGTAMIVNFLLDGREYMALNGGPDLQLNEAFSLFVSVETQEEVDDLWKKLTDGGEEVQCGWLKDKFGLSWQIVPTALGRLMGDPDPVKSQRVMQAMLQMKKIDVAGLQRAYEGK